MEKVKSMFLKAVQSYARRWRRSLKISFVQLNSHIQRNELKSKIHGAKKSLQINGFSLQKRGKSDISITSTL